jgi:hypothetical protein
LREIPGIEKSIVPATPDAPRHGGQSVARLKDGGLLLLWSEFGREDQLPAGKRTPRPTAGRRPAARAQLTPVAAEHVLAGEMGITDWRRHRLIVPWLEGR